MSFNKNTCCDDPNCPAKLLVSMMGLGSESAATGTDGGTDAGNAGIGPTVSPNGMSATQLSTLSALMGRGSGDSPRQNESSEAFIKRKNLDENKTGYYLVKRTESVDRTVLTYVKKVAYDANPDLDSLDSSNLRKITLKSSMVEAARTLKFYTPAARARPSGSDLNSGMSALLAALTGVASPSEYSTISAEVGKIIKPTPIEQLGPRDAYIARVDRQLREATPNKPALVPVIRSPAKSPGIAIHYVKKEICDQTDLTMDKLMQASSWAVTGPLSAFSALQKIELYDFPNNSCESEDTASSLFSGLADLGSLGSLDSLFGTSTEDESTPESNTRSGPGSSSSILASLLSAMTGIPLDSSGETDADGVAESSPETETETETEIEPDPETAPVSNTEPTTSSDVEMPSDNSPDASTEQVDGDIESDFESDSDESDSE